MLGITQNQVSNIILGKRGVTPMLIEILKYKLNVNPDYLTKGELPMFREDPELENTSIPLLGEIPAGDWKYWIDSYPPGAADEWISCPDIYGENFFAIRVDGDSMEPELHPSDILIINPYKKFQSGIAVVRHKEGFKIRMVKKMKKDRWLLYPLNPKHESLEITPDNETRLYVPVKVISMRDI